jgi:hypothetical protein
MPRLLAITAFPGFVYVFNNSYFWLWYSRLWTCDQSVTDSSRNNHNIPQLVQDEGCPVKFYDWKTFLKQFFKPLSSLTTYHHFRADKDSPGIVFVKEYCDSLEKEFYHVT